MESLTKVDLDHGVVASAIQRALGDDAPATGVRPLTDGMFNAAYAAVRADGTEVVIKVAPPDDVPVLTYECHLMAAEVDFYRRSRGVLPVPEVLAVDFDRTVVDRDVLVMSYLQGQPLNAAKGGMSRTGRAAVQRELGAAVARLGSVTGERFGYERPDAGLAADSWSAAFALMVGAILEDAARYGVSLPRAAAHLMGLLERAAPELDTVATPALVHFDIWDGNVFVDSGPDGHRLEAIIDGERAFWGDPLAELVSTSLFKDPAKATHFNAGYAEAAGAPPGLEDGGRLRLALYRAYLDVIMLVEGTPRGYRGAQHRALEAFVARDLSRQVRTARGLLA